MSDPGLREPLARAAWARALMRRLEGISEVPTILALWRGFAWSSLGSPKKGFELRAEDLLESEGVLLDRIESEVARDR